GRRALAGRRDRHGPRPGLHPLRALPTQVPDVSQPASRGRQSARADVADQGGDAWVGRVRRPALSSARLSVLQLPRLRNGMPVRCPVRNRDGDGAGEDAAAEPPRPNGAHHAPQRLAAASETPPPRGLALSRHEGTAADRKSTRLNSSHVAISYAVFCLKKKTVCKY